MSVRRQFQNVEEDDTFIATVINHISAFQVVVQYCGNYLEARVLPSITCNPQVGDNVVVKPYPRGGFNLIVSGVDHEPADVILSGIFCNNMTFAAASEHGIIKRKTLSKWDTGLIPSNIWHTIAAPFDGPEDFLVMRPFIYSKDVYFLFASINQDDTGAGDNPNNLINAYLDGLIQVFRTVDGGQNWTYISHPDAYARWQSFGRDSNGRIWGTAYREDTVSTLSRYNYIYYSDNLGDTWTLAYSEGPLTSGTGNQRYIVDIIVHPTNPLFIMAFGHDNVNSGRIHTWYSNNGGSSWTHTRLTSTKTFTSSNKPEFETSPNWKHSAKPIWLPSGRLIFYGSPFSPGKLTYLIYTDDYVNWTTVFDPYFNNTYSPYKEVDNVWFLSDGAVRWIMKIEADSDESRLIMFMWSHAQSGTILGGPIFPYYREIMVSYDKGETWTTPVLSTMACVEDFYGTGESVDTTRDNIQNMGMAYDEISDSLYLFNTGPNFYDGTDSDPTNQFVVHKISPIVVNSAICDITSDLIPYISENRTVNKIFYNESGLANFINLYPY